VFAKGTEWLNTATGIALLPVRLGMLSGYPEKSLPEALGLEGTGFFERRRPFFEGKIGLPGVDKLAPLALPNG